MILKKKFDNKTFRIILFVLFIIITSFFISHYFFQIALIQGDSMSPTLNNLDVVLIDKRKNNTIERNDIVVVKIDNLDAKVIKRVVGIPNDKLIIKNKKLYVNDVLFEPYFNKLFSFGGIIENKELVLKQNEYFVIGDNIEKSKDSRYQDIGVIDIACIVGKIIK